MGGGRGGGGKDRGRRAGVGARGSICRWQAAAARRVWPAENRWRRLARQLCSLSVCVLGEPHLLHTHTHCSRTVQEVDVIAEA